MRTLIVAGVMAGLALAGCGATQSADSSAQATASHNANTGKKAPELAKYVASLSAVSLSVTNVVVDLAALPTSTASESDLVTLGQDATAAHTALTDASDVVADNVDLFTAATDLAASMSTLGDLASSPTGAGAAATYETQYGQGSHEWNSAVDALCAAAGSSAAKTYEVPLAGS